MWQPLCYAQIGGLAVATFITLLLVPVLYSIAVLDLRIVKWETKPKETLKTPGKDMHTERESSQTKSEATDLVIEPVLEQEAIARLAYFYWEDRGCQNDSPDENWFKAEAELRNRLAAAATD